MRLGQLARKLAIRPSEIAEFLASKHIQIEEGSNTRLEDDHVAMIMKEFALSANAELAAELDFNEDPDDGDSRLLETKTDEKERYSDEKLIAEISSPAGSVQEEKPAVIKAAKVELPGLKVVGKIDFPEPKKKEPSADAAPPEEQPPAREEEKKRRWEDRKTSLSRKERSVPRETKNPIALQREREAMEAEKKRGADAELEKEKRTQHYLRKVKVSSPTKKVRMVDEPIMEMSAIPDEPKSLLGRFVKWLTT